MTTKINLFANSHYKKSGTKSYLYAMRKYRFSPTKDGPYSLGTTMVQTGRPFTRKPIGGRARLQQVLQKKSADSDQIGQVGPDDVQNDSMYLAEVGIGTPVQTLNLEIDTASADLWVWSTAISSKTLVENDNHTVFDPVKSSTYKEEECLTWRISYGDGSFASGVVGSDNVNIGRLAIKDQVVELADVLSEHFTRGAGDGLLGLALGNINSVKSWATSTPVENIISQSGIPESAALFTANLESWQDTDELDKGGFFYTFGYIDQDTVKATGAEIHYTPVDKSQGFWSFESTSATVNRQSFSRSGNKAIADTGTALALVDDETCQAIYDAIPGAQYDDVSQGWIYPSNTRADKLPIVSFDIGGKQFVLQKEDLGFAEAKSGYIYGGIQSRGTMTMDILGGTFLKAIYAVFDVGNLRFGAVQLRELH